MKMPDYESEVMNCPDCGKLVETGKKGRGKCSFCETVVYTNSRLLDMKGRQPKKKKLKPKKEVVDKSMNTWQRCASLREDIVKFIVENSHGYEHGCKCGTIARGISENTRMVSKQLKCLESDGKVESVRWGWWRIPVVGENDEDVSSEKVLEDIEADSAPIGKKNDQEDVLITGSKLAKVCLSVDGQQLFLDKSKISFIGLILKADDGYGFDIIVDSQAVTVFHPSKKSVSKVHSYLIGEISQQHCLLD